MTIYQLRRLHIGQSPQSLLPDDTVLLYQTTKIGRNPDLVDVVLISQVHSNMISREHTTIFVKARRDRYACFIKDHSLNGTYVNDFRVFGESELQQGDVIKFGHVNGAAIKPGCYGPQTSAEFTFVFEEAPPHRLSDRRRPITIMGSARQDFSQVLVGDGKNLHTTSRLPLTNSSMELTTAWQNPAAAAAGAAAAPFYNLQRFPSYYQAAFPQFSSAYLHSLWPQNAWPSQPSTTTQQFQQHQLEQQKQAEAVGATAAMFFQQYGQLTNSAWMGANAQIATDTSSFMGATSESRLRSVVPEQVSSPSVTSNITFQMAAAAVAGACSHRPASAAEAITDQSSGLLSQDISMQNDQLLQSFAQHTPASRSRALASTALSENAPLTQSNGTAATYQHHYPANARVIDTQRTSRLTDSSPTQVIATPSAIDSVKRMECDSSVPSPPKSQQQQQITAAVLGVVPTGVVGVHRTATTTVSSQSPVTAIHAATQVQVQVPASLPSAAAMLSGSERRFSHGIPTPISTCSTSTISSAVPAAITGMNVRAAALIPSGCAASAASPQVPMLPSKISVTTQERPMEELQRENAERNSRLSGLEELTEDLLEDCGPPRRAPTPASSSSELLVASTVRQDSLVTEEREPSESLRSSLHQSPKRRGHGHSDSSYSPTQTPISVEQKVEPKKRRKNNEVAMLLNDLTEVAWHHLARKSSNKITAPTQTRKVYTNEEDDADKRSCKSDSSDSEKPAKKKQQQKGVTKAKSISCFKAKDFDRGTTRKRGRPKKDYFTSKNVATENLPKKKATGKKKKKKNSSSSDNISSDSEGGGDEGREDMKEPRILPKGQSGTSAAEKIERALAMMKKRQTLRDSDDESNSSSFVSSSSPSPIRRIWGATSQRKTGSSSVSKKKMSKAGRQSRSLSMIPRTQPIKGIATSSTSTRKKGRKKKRRSSSSESELSLETSSVEWEKIKPVITPLPAAHAPMLFDEWTYHDPEKQCDARSGCKKPQSESVVWVQCDYCCRWYHMECVANQGVAVGNSDDFNCGCRESNRAS